MSAYDDFYGVTVFECQWCHETVTERPLGSDTTYYPFCCSLCACRADVDSSEPERLETMKQTSTLTRNLAEQQERHARRMAVVPMVFRIYTESRPNLHAIVSSFLPGATFYSATGLWQGQTEPATVVEFAGFATDFDVVQEIARTIRRENEQSAVIVTSAVLHSVDFVTE